MKEFIVHVSYSFAVGNSWYMIFKDENFAGTIKTIDNYVSKDIYELAGTINNNYKTCLALSEMQELLAFFPSPNLLRPINSFPLTDYTPPISQLNIKLCKKHPQSCLNSLLNPRN